MVGKNNLRVHKKAYQTLPWDRKARENSGSLNQYRHSRKRNEKAPTEESTESELEGLVSDADSNLNDNFDSPDSETSEQYVQDASRMGGFRRSLGRIQVKTAASKAVDYAARMAAKIKIPGIPTAVALGISGTIAAASLTGCSGGTPTNTPALPPIVIHTEVVVHEPTSTPHYVQQTTVPDSPEYSPLLTEAMSKYPEKFNFDGRGLNPIEERTMRLADAKFFTNKNFLESKYGPKNWPSEVKTASIQALLLMMDEIDIKRKPKGRHKIGWSPGSLDEVLNDLNVYSNADEIPGDYEVIASIATDPGYNHRIMLKELAYFGKADDAGILPKSLMQNDVDDFNNLLSPSDAQFGFGDSTFMYLGMNPDGTTKSFPSMVFEAAGDATNQRETVEQLFDYLVPGYNVPSYKSNKYDFANFFSANTPTPAASIDLMTLALRSLGLNADSSITPDGMHIGSVKTNGGLLYYNANDLWTLTTDRLSGCALLGDSAEDTENRKYDLSCSE